MVGIAVDCSLLKDEAAELNAGYLMRQTAGRPLVTLKLAATLDGRIATAAGESRWITGAAARAYGHHLRATHDAVLVGGGTALADDPRLDVRLAGLEDRAPLRVVLDGRLRLPAGHDLVARAGEQPTLLLTRPGGDEEKAAALRAAGVEVEEVAADGDGRLSLPAVLQLLGARGITRLLGRRRRAGRGVPYSRRLGRPPGLVPCPRRHRRRRPAGGRRHGPWPGLAEMPRFRRLEVQSLGEDLVESYALLT